MPTAYQKDGSIFKKLQELFLKSQGLFNVRSHHKKARTNPIESLLHIFFHT